MHIRQSQPQLPENKHLDIFEQKTLNELKMFDELTKPKEKAEIINVLNDAFDDLVFPEHTKQLALELSMKYHRNREEFNQEEYDRIQKENKALLEGLAYEEEIARKKAKKPSPHIKRMADDLETLNVVSSRVGIFILATNAIVGAIVHIAMSIAKSAGVIEANMKVASVILQQTVNVASYSMPVLLSTIAVEGMSDAFKALLNKKTDARVSSVVEGFVKTGLSTAGLFQTGFSAVGFVPIGALQIVPMPFLFLGIVLAGVTKTQMVINEIRKKASVLTKEINNDKKELSARISHLHNVKDIDIDPGIKLLAIKIAQNEQKLNIMQIKEKSAVHSRDKLLVVGLISISFLIAAASFPPVSIAFALLTAAGMAIFLGVNRYLHNHSIETAEKIKTLEAEKLDAKKVVENAKKGPLQKSVAPKSTGLFENACAFFSGPQKFIRDAAASRIENNNLVRLSY